MRFSPPVKMIGRCEAIEEETEIMEHSRRRAGKAGLIGDTGPAAVLGPGKKVADNSSDTLT